MITEEWEDMIRIQDIIMCTVETTDGIPAVAVHRLHITVQLPKYPES